jgi:hypothetical protein
MRSHEEGRKVMLKTDEETKGVNPYRRCVCANWNNDDGTCSYCEWEEEHSEEETE